MHNWLLPEYIEDLLPPTALRMENLRRAILNLFRVHGYELVTPPLIEYIDSLLTGAGSDLDLKTFKLVDQISGKTMGLRADITPQVARIDAHLLNRQGVTRLCYAGSVVHTLPDGTNRSRELMQLGAELYGHPSYEADVEIQKLMLNALKLTGAGELHLDIGHVGVFRGLLQYANITDEQVAPLFAALQAKDISTIRELTAHLDASLQDAFCALPSLYGGVEVLDEAFRVLPSHLDISQALEELRAIINELKDEAKINIDLAELRGYHYHSGVVFAVYTSNHPVPLAQGGRYDEVGKSFGRARPATGFSLDLREIATQFWRAAGAQAILAPYLKNAKLAEKINELRTSGEIVIVDLPGHEAHRNEYDYDRILSQDAQGEWTVSKRPDQLQ
ncbi:ATP phosphoribosyltransferase regulatory subunit [Sulfuriferula sp. AH1]|uniref:ATP phosphoribosyltransferase regulatory subunit n=1 Tax=Sulfuriferula sp. AH1 TaxID=1985873 RepID=UPI000B3B85C0|nr:ATP phosphoribosyltransferase regulatory subunit [Sulfuriferula sp. AH1]ARU31237.1 ATP phosphoribosyltransferase regulatory subunit [Sulfuriferula sp. AH1]